MFPTRFNCNALERNKGHAPGNTNSIIAIPYDTSDGCPTPNSAAASKYKQNIINHLKLWHHVNQKKTENCNSKIFSFCRRTFSRRFNRDLHIEMHLVMKV